MADASARVVAPDAVRAARLVSPDTERPVADASARLVSPDTERAVADASARVVAPLTFRSIRDVRPAATKYPSTSQFSVTDKERADTVSNEVKPITVRSESSIVSPVKTV